MGLMCDICLKPVPEGHGYALTTTEVSTTVAYWEYAFTHQWSYVSKMVDSSEISSRGILRELAQQM